jgi:hypothetical protein
LKPPTSLLPQSRLIMAWSHQAFRHSAVSIVASASAFLSGVMSFFTLLKARLYSIAIAGMERNSAHFRSLQAPCPSRPTPRSRIRSKDHRRWKCLYWVVEAQANEMKEMGWENRDISLRGTRAATYTYSSSIYTIPGIGHAPTRPTKPDGTPWACTKLLPSQVFCTACWGALHPCLSLILLLFAPSLLPFPSSSPS